MESGKNHCMHAATYKTLQSTPRTESVYAQQKFGIHSCTYTLQDTPRAESACLNQELFLPGDHLHPTAASHGTGKPMSIQDSPFREELTL